MNELLVQIGEDLMESIGETFPPDDFPSVDEIIAEIEKTGMPFCDDSMQSVCIINAQRINEFLKSNVKNEAFRNET